MTPNETIYLTGKVLFKDEVADLVYDNTMKCVIIEVKVDEAIKGYLVTRLPNDLTPASYRRNKDYLVKLCTGIGAVKRGISVASGKGVNLRLVSKVVAPRAPVYYWSDSSSLIEDLLLDKVYRTGDAKTFRGLWGRIAQMHKQENIGLPNVTRMILNPQDLTFCQLSTNPIPGYHPPA